MRFGIMGSVVQFTPSSEGHLLWRAGLLQTDGLMGAAEYHPTQLLRSLFTDIPEMEELYPVLVEFVLIFRYLDIPEFVDAEATVRRLTELGITPEGLTMLSKLVTYVVQRI
jgi:hypothetical protein